MTSRKPSRRPTVREIEILDTALIETRPTVPASPQSQRKEPRPSGSYSLSRGETEVLAVPPRRRRARAS